MAVELSQDLEIAQRVLEVPSTFSNRFFVNINSELGFVRLTFAEYTHVDSKPQIRTAVTLPFGLAHDLVTVLVELFKGIAQAQAQARATVAANGGITGEVEVGEGAIFPPPPGLKPN